jgi:thiamine-phosphate pyrophosphorylase
LRFVLPKVYPITDTRLSGLSHLEQVISLVAGGASLIQLRDKNAPAGEFYDGARDAVDHAHRNGAKIIINDRVDLALALGADGVHLGQDDLGPEHARKLLGPSAIIGFSTHSVEQAIEALTLPIDYLAIGPIFATATKEDHDPVVGVELLRVVRRLDPAFPIVAIGGIDRRNAASVIDAGADSVAMISDIISEPSQIESRMREILTSLRND